MSASSDDKSPKTEADDEAPSAELEHDTLLRELARVDTELIAPSGEDTSGALSGSARPVAGEVIEGKYRLVRLIGAGGMGVVYEADHLLLGRRVAVKLLTDAPGGRPEAVRRFLREARAASAIGHPNIITVHDVGRSADGRVYMVMELLRGCSLRELLRTESRLDTESTIAVAMQILSAIEAVHAIGIVHRDLKPDNVFLALDEATGQVSVKLLDFGISKIRFGDASSQELTQSGVIMGTAYYMSPEQCRSPKDVDERSDIWSIGVMLYEMLSGARPFVDTAVWTTLLKILHDLYQPLEEVASDVAPELAAVVERALEKDADARYSDARELATALKQAWRSLSDRPLSSVTRVLSDRVANAQVTSATDSVQMPGSAGSEPGPRTSDSWRLAGDLAYGVARPSRWRLMVWALICLPLSWGMLAISVMRPNVVEAAFGLPESTPTVVPVAISVLLCSALSVAAFGISRSWRRREGSTWLFGLGFAAFPVLGLLLVLYHLVTLNGRRDAYLLALRSYSEISTLQAEDISQQFSRSTDSFLGGLAVDLGFVSLLAMLILLGCLFVPFVRGREARDRLRWLPIPIGLCVIASAELVPVSSDALSFLGIWRFVLYACWLLTAIALARMPDRSPMSRTWSRRSFSIGLITAWGVSGVAFQLGYLMFCDILERSDSIEAREWRMDSIRPSMIEGFATVWCVLAVTYGILFVARRRMLLSGPLAQSRWHGWTASAVTIAALAIPHGVLFDAMAGYNDRYLAYKVVDMVPSSLLGEDRPSFYIDAAPRSLSRYSEGLYRRLLGRPFDPLPDYTWCDLGELLAGFDSCGELLEATLVSDGDSVPARCITGVEAQYYCNSLGKRLPTRAEWESALASVDVRRPETGTHELCRGPFAEWVLGGSPESSVIEVAGRREVPEAPEQLDEDAFSPWVGFRCAMRF